FKTIVLLSDLCHLNSDRGTVCSGYVLRWYYNEAVGACLPFWYGGCDGNSNRFNSEKECLQTCGKQSKSFWHGNDKLHL
uniref:BPTI/Kunitz inhibitor domain-containing protein n=1 Tax=Sinocyclocheilus grahami TaxID=75366 RepID=A0A672PVU1_SINGR